MNSRLLKIVFVVTCLLLYATKLYSWPLDPQAWISPWYTYTTINKAVNFNARSGSYDPDNGYPHCCGTGITNYHWIWPDAAQDPTPSKENPDECCSGLASCHFHATGVYDLHVIVTDDEGATNWDWARVYVVKVNIDGGGYVVLNDDDDNNSGYPDKDESGPITGENDLVPIYLSVDPPDAPGSVILRALSGGEKIKVWYEQTKQTQVTLPATWAPSRGVPSTLWVEGFAISSSLNDIELEFSYKYYTSQPAVDSDTIQFTVYSTEVPIIVELEDPKVNEVRSGLDEDSLCFWLNDERIPNSELTLEHTYEQVDGEQVLAKLKVTYIPPRAKLIIPGTNEVAASIADKVFNLMEPVVTTFDMP